MEPGGLGPHFLTSIHPLQVLEKAKTTSTKRQSTPATTIPAMPSESVVVSEPVKVSPTGQIVKRHTKVKALQADRLETPSMIIPTLKQAAEAYVEAKKLTWFQASTKDIPPQVKQFIEIVIDLEHGRDIPVTQLNRDHIRRYYDTLRHLPHRVNGKKEYRNKSWLALADMGRQGQCSAAAVVMFKTLGRIQTLSRPHFIL